MTNKWIVWVRTWCSTRCTMEIDHLIADADCNFRLFSNPHVSNMVLMLMMMIVRNKDNCILNLTAPVPWPTPLTRDISLDSLSPVLSLTDVCGSWLPPQLVTSLEPPLGPGWHPRSHILMFTYPAQGINCLDLITLEDETGVPYSRLEFWFWWCSVIMLSWSSKHDFHIVLLSKISNELTT